MDAPKECPKCLAVMEIRQSIFERHVLNCFQKVIYCHICVNKNSPAKRIQTYKSLDKFKEHYISHKKEDRIFDMSKIDQLSEDIEKNNEKSKQSEETGSKNLKKKFESIIVDKADKARTRNNFKDRKCEECNLTFKNSDKARFHYHNHHKKVSKECPKCLTVLNVRKPHYKDHVKNCFQKVFHCHICLNKNNPGKKTTSYKRSIQQFKKHYRSHKNEDKILDLSNLDQLSKYF